MGATTVRFRDPSSAYSLYGFARSAVDVVCPRCGAHARVVPGPDDDQRRLVCGGCGHAKGWQASRQTTWWGVAADPYFRQPLWLTTSVHGHRLWAYNLEHLNLLTEFVGAGLRERGAHGGCDMSVIEKLPAWLKSARNRDDVLAALGRLRARLDDRGRTVARRKPATAAELARLGGSRCIRMF